MLNRWIMNIVAIGIFAMVADLVLSEKNIKKYIRFFVGLIILIIIVEPISKIVKAVPNLDDKVLSGLEDWGMEGDSVGRVSKNNKDYIMDLYRRNLEGDISRRVGGYLPNYTVWSSVILEDVGKDGSFSIKGIHVILSPGEGIKIKPVIVSTKIEEPNDNDHNSFIGETMEWIRKELALIYEVEESKIEIEMGS